MRVPILLEVLLQIVGRVLRLINAEWRQRRVVHVLDLDAELIPHSVIDIVRPLTVPYKSAEAALADLVP